MGPHFGQGFWWVYIFEWVPAIVCTKTLNDATFDFLKSIRFHFSKNFIQIEIFNSVVASPFPEITHDMQTTDFVLKNRW